jgi:hypothetical protein
MRWWWSPSPPRRSDDEIVARVNAMVASGKIQPGMAQMFERALRDVADGKAVDMVDLMRSVLPPKFPKPRS